jgi:signal transduction histidine kinase
LFLIERQTREKFARIEYETNEIISEKKGIENENEEIKNKLQSVSSIAVVIILVILLLYFIKSRNLKNQEIKFIQEKQNSKEEIYTLMLNQQQRIQEGKYYEKNRISQELHDGVMGKLTGIRLNLFILKKRQDTETIQKCLPFIDDIQNIEIEIRQIAHDLNQNLFDDNVTFTSIVENLFTMIKNHSDIEFNLQVDERIDWDLMSYNIKINIYRIIQETLQNIDKYAQASKVNLKMNKYENEIHITISDNGIGFNPNTNKKGIGLNNMRKRMEEINGQFLLESTRKKGTKISLQFKI